MSATFEFTLQAKQDLLDIADYLEAEAGSEVADKVVDQLYNGATRIAETPGLGHYREELLDQSFRFYSIYSYVMIYRWQCSPIVIIAVIHGARNLPAVLARRRIS